MHKLISRLRKNEKGQSLVEFALVVIPLMVLILGMIEFGWLFNGQITVTSSAREGARVAAVNSSQDNKVFEAVQRHVSGSGLTVTDGNIDIMYGDDDVTVSVVASIEPLVGFFVKSTVYLTAEAVMRRE